MSSPGRCPATLIPSITLLLALLGSGCREAEPPPDFPPRAIRWMKVSGTLPAEQRVVSGIVMAVDDTRLAFEVGGSVDTVEVQLGDHVVRNQVLARLDPEPFELAVRDARAELDKAIAARQRAESDYARTLSLYRENVASRQELDRNTASRDSSISQVEASRARLELAERDLRRSVLRAPFDGAISVRNIDPAMKLISGQGAFEMDSEESGLRVEVQMPETLILRVRQGSSVDVSFPSLTTSPGGGAQVATAEAVVTEIGTRASTGNAFPVRANLISPPDGLRPGMTAELSFALEAAPGSDLGLDGFVIPFSAINAEAEEAFSVFVYEHDSSTVKQTPVRTGGVRDNEVAVLEGLSEGQIIATAGVAFLRDGQEVRLMDESIELTRQ